MFIQEVSGVEKKIMKIAHKKRSPVNGSIELLPLCNMNCDMCYVRLSRKDMEEKGRIRTPTEWIKLGKEMREAGVLFLLLTGGEPLLYPEFKRVYTELYKMGFILTINTNGTLIDENLAKILGEHKPRRVNVTLYGTNEDLYEKLCHHRGGFEQTINGIKLLKKYGVDVKISGSLTRLNEDSVENIIEIGKELDVPVNIDTYMLPATRERNNPYNKEIRLNSEDAARARIKVLRLEMGVDRFYEFARQKLYVIDNIVLREENHPQMNCYAGKCSFTVNWRGGLQPCVILSKPQINVFDKGFQKCWNYISAEIDKITLNKKCNSCRIRPMCRVCVASSLCETGKYDGVPEYMCRYADASVKELREYMVIMSERDC